VGGQDAVHGFNGTWALFKLFFSTDDFRPDAGGYRVRWNLQAGGNFVPVEGQLFLTGPAILNRAYMAGLQCPSRLTR
jgi:type VI protein secretion system component VasK